MKNMHDIDKLKDVHFSLDLDKTRHIIIDVQNGWYAPNGDGATKLHWDTSSMQEAANRLQIFLAKTRHILKPVFFQMEESATTAPSNIPPRTIELCKLGTYNYSFFKVQPLDCEPTFHKTHPSAFQNKDFIAYLKSKKIETLIFSGGLASRCIFSTVVSASIEGFNIIVIDDLTENPLQFQKEKEEFKKVGRLLYAYYIHSSEIIHFIENSKD